MPSTVVWIGVDEWTPDAGQFVLICSTGGKHTYYAQYVGQGKFLAENSAKLADYNQGGCDTVHLPAEPTHWAYLPHIDGVEQR